MKTFKDVKHQHLKYLETHGWDVKRYHHRTFELLSMPHATHPTGAKLWFRPQAVYLGESGFPESDARSLCEDMRRYLPSELEALALEVFQRNGD